MCIIINVYYYHYNYLKGNNEMKKVLKLTMGSALCAVDLGDGSERGEYVSQDYILSKLGRPHRSISLM